MKNNIHSFDDLADAKNRLIYELALGKPIRLSQWRVVKELLASAGLPTNDDSLHFLADLKRNNPKMKHTGSMVKKLQFIFARIKQQGGNLSGFELELLVRKLAVEETGIEPKQSTVYRWFKKTSRKGFNKMGVYYQKDILIVASVAISFNPDYNPECKKVYAETLKVKND